MKKQASQHRLRPHLAAMAALCLFAASPAFADSLTTNAAGGYGRILFTLSPPGNPVAAVKDGVLTIHFDRKVALSPKPIVHGLPAYLSSGRADTDGKTFRFALVEPVRLHSSIAADKYALDLVPASFAGTPPDLAPPPPPPGFWNGPPLLPPLPPPFPPARSATSRSVSRGSSTSRYSRASFGRECSSCSLRTQRAVAEPQTDQLRVPWRESSSTLMVSRSTCRERPRPDGDTVTTCREAWSLGPRTIMERAGASLHRRLSGRWRLPPGRF